MSTRVYLSNEPGDLSGYLKLLLGSPGRLASTTVSTAVTTTTSSGDNIPMTLTEGGPAAKWISAPFKKAVTIAALVQARLYAAESNAAANAGLGVRLAQYTTTEQAVFLDYNHTVELGTTIATLTTANIFVTTAPTSTAFAIGDRLVVYIDAVAVGTMGASQTTTLNYNGAAGTVGESYLTFQETLESGAAQSPQIVGGPSVARLQDFLWELDPYVKAKFGGTATVPAQVDWNVLRNEIIADRDRGSA